MTRENVLELGQLAAAAAAILGLLALLSKATRSAVRTLRRLGRLADEILGDADRPGWGVRIKAIEARLTGVEAKVATVVAEVKPNGGSSMRDEVKRIAEATGANDQSA